jgi:putative ABC transport system substrate-binding protein
MKRREFIGLFGAAAVTRPRAARAQQSTIWRIGIATIQSRTTPIYAAFEQRLRELGYVEGQNLVLDYLNPEMQAEGVAGAIKELLRRKVDIIVAPYESGVKAALAASETVPVVMIATEYDPLALGYVNSLARPGGHVTGVFLQQIELASKRLQLLKDALPSFQSAIMFWDALSEYQWKATNSAAAPFGLRLAGVELVKQPYDYEGAWASVPPDSRNTLILPIAPVFYRERERLADFAIRHGIASMFAVREFATAGGLMSYGPDFPAMFRRVAEYVDRIAKGAKAADLPLNSLPSSSWSSIAKPQRPSTSIFQTSCSRSPTR